MYLLAVWFVVCFGPGFASASVPTVFVSGVSLADRDLDASEIGGTVEWTEPTVTTAVTGYDVGFAYDASGAAFAILGSLALGTNAVNIGHDLVIGSFTNVVVYTVNAHGRQATPQAEALSDAVAIVSSVTFADKDLDVTEVGGDVTWSPPSDTSPVTEYYAYLATSQFGASRSQIDAVVPVGTNIVSLAPETPINLYGYIVVYTKSSLAEQTTPVSGVLSDTLAPVSSLLFTDRDLDADELGGPITWQEPVDTAQVVGYTVYWAEDAAGSVKAVITSLPAGSVSHDIVANTPITSKTHVLVYSLSSLAEQSTPVAHAILDRSSSVTNLAFPDTDLDAADIGGDITWTAPLDTSQVTHYSVYFALSEAGVGGAQLGSDIPVATNLPVVPLDTPAGSYNHIVAYTKSALTEQTTPVGLLIHNAYGAVTDITLEDKDLDAGQLGGTITWTAPSDEAQLVEYNVYLATSSAGASRSQLGSAVTLHTNAIALPSDFDPVLLTHIVVYSASSDAEQTTPSFIALSDTEASVTSLDFTDYDLDGGELLGTVTWSPAGDATHVTLYRAFLAADAAGTSRSQIEGDLDYGVMTGPGTNKVELPVDTPAPSYSHIVVFSASALAEQTTPVALAISDSTQSASSTTFTDLDLDPSDLGGAVTWTEPAETAQVTYYVVYLATDASGSDKSLVGSDVMGVFVGTTDIDIAVDTSLISYSHLVVFTRSAFAEQTTPDALTLADTGIAISGIDLVDLDLDLYDLAGSLTWDPASDPTLVTHYALYVSSADGSSRTQLHSDVVVGTNALTLFADTSRGTNTHFTLYARSSLAEQTTPAGYALIADADGSVQDLTFGDRDFDEDEIGGTIHWEAPVDTSEVTHYAVYRARDALGTGYIQVGNVVSVGTNYVTLPVSTPLSTYTHMVVYTKSSLDFMTTPAAVVIADTPVITTTTRWTIMNAEATTPRQDGRWSTPEQGSQWRIKELEFYSDFDCTQRLVGSSTLSSGNTGKYHVPGMAFDDNLDTEWHAQCSPCAAEEAWLGVTVASVVRCVRWLQAPVLSGSGVRSVIFNIGGVELAKAPGLQGGRWEGLQYAAAAGGWQRIC
mmetsp:Transcript_80879/g.203437  ORF Transcript_80879/g.203437 Transcript_80879/m.203437 type:complete len:1087 (+) Transcript_80879:96-3356(+)